VLFKIGRNSQNQHERSPALHPAKIDILNHCDFDINLSYRLHVRSAVEVGNASSFIQFEVFYLWISDSIFQWVTNGFMLWFISLIVNRLVYVKYPRKGRMGSVEKRG